MQISTGQWPWLAANFKACITVVKFVTSIQTGEYGTGNDLFNEALNTFYLRYMASENGTIIQSSLLSFSLFMSFSFYLSLFIFLFLFHYLSLFISFIFLFLFLFLFLLYLSLSLFVSFYIFLLSFSLSFFFFLFLFLSSFLRFSFYISFFLSFSHYLSFSYLFIFLFIFIFLSFYLSLFIPLYLSLYLFLSFYLFSLYLSFSLYIFLFYLSLFLFSFSLTIYLFYLSLFIFLSSFSSSFSLYHFNFLSFYLSLSLSTAEWRPRVPGEGQVWHGRGTRVLPTRRNPQLHDPQDDLDSHVTLWPLGHAADGRDLGSRCKRPWPFCHAGKSIFMLKMTAILLHHCREIGGFLDFDKVFTIYALMW